MNGNAMLTPRLFFFFAKRFPAGRWSFLGPGSEKKWYSTHGSRPQGEWDRVAAEYRALDRFDGEPMEFEWNIFQGFNTLQLIVVGQYHMTKDTEEFS